MVIELVSLHNSKVAKCHLGPFVMVGQYSFPDFISSLKEGLIDPVWSFYPKRSIFIVLYNDFSLIL